MCLSVAFVACSGGQDATPDMGGQEADVGVVDAGLVDSGTPDASPQDSGSSSPDSGPADLGAVDAGDPDFGSLPDLGLEEPLSEYVFYSTHNSYSEGHAGSEVGPLLEQLTNGVRFVELDVHDNDFETSHYRVGHDAPGDEVSYEGGNPSGDELRLWLQQIQGWSSANPDHVPITIGLDMKDSLTDNMSFSAGNLGAFNGLLTEVFGEQLYTAEELERAGSWPSLDALRGRVIAVLSGDEGTRLSYRRDTANNPSVSINTSGMVLEVHDSGSGELWYWSGQMDSQGEVRWLRHARYDTGDAPSVVLMDDGYVVEVHEAPGLNDRKLWYRVGQLGSDGNLSWSQAGGRSFPGDDEGVRPSLGMLSGTMVREIHESASTGLRWYWSGELNRGSGDVTWTRSDKGRTDDPLFPRALATRGARTIEVSVGDHGPFGSDTLRYRPGTTGAHSRIRYRQLAFVEVQFGGASELEAEGLQFFAGNARTIAVKAWAEGWRSQGKLVRLWTFNNVNWASDPPANFSATDHPEAAWYREYCAMIGCVR